MSKFFLFLILTLSLKAQANNFIKYYESHNHIFEKPVYLKPNEQPILEETSSMEDFMLARENLRSKGHASLGSSQFLDYKISEKLALEQAKKIKATHVITLTELANKGMSFQRGEDPNKLSWVYSYFAFYTIKDEGFFTGMLGFLGRDLNSEEKKKYQRNTGTLVTTVFEDTRSYLANVLKDDVITHINQTPLIRYNDFERIRDEELKKSNILNLSILRIVNGDLKEIVIPITIN